MSIQIPIKKKILFLAVFIASGIFSIITIGGFVVAEGVNSSQGKVFVMYAGSLLKTFESFRESFVNIDNFGSTVI